MKLIAELLTSLLQSDGTRRNDNSEKKSKKGRGQGRNRQTRSK